MVKQNILVLLAACGLGFASGCDTNQPGGLTPIGTSSAELGANAIFEEESGLKVEPQNLPMLSQNHYQAWVVTEGEESSVGRFNIDEEGMMYQVDEAGERMESEESDVSAQGAYEQEQSQEKQQEEEESEQEQPEDTTETPETEPTPESPDTDQAPEKFLVSVEANGGGEGEAGGAILLSGEFNEEGVAEATVISEEALGTDFASAQGSFVLGPQSLEATEENQGVWFFNPEEEVAALELPELPTGWIYEAWIEDSSSEEFSSLGRFSSVDEASVESDGVTTEEEGEEGLQFPGADFEALDRNFADGNHRVFITIAPEQGELEEPLPFEILSVEIPQDAVRGELVELNQEVFELPTVRAEHMASNPEEESTEDTSDDSEAEGDEESESETESETDAETES